MSGLLPEGFEALEPFAGRWSVTGTAARAARRGASSAEEREAFYTTAKDLLVPALAYLDAKPLAEFSPEENRLMDMMLSLAHVALAVEALGDDEPRHANMRQYMHITRSPAGA
jgi:hypothetical protein